MTDIVSLGVVRFCAIECKLQQSGEESVAWMVEAWKLAEKMRPDQISRVGVLLLGQLVEPVVNAEGFRTVGVRVGSNIKPPWDEVPGLMDEWVANAYTFTPEEMFRQYEEIHPFRDGNGRTGVILYNLRCGTLDTPQWAPDFWNDRRRSPGYGAPRR